MKRLKFTMLAIVCATLFAFSSCDDDNYNPGSVVESALNSKYPNATRVEWEKKGNYMVADCWVGNKDMEVWYSADAEWKMTETELLQSELPAPVSAAVAASTYSAWRIDDVDLLEYPSKPKEYVIEVEQGNKETDMYYSETGELLRTKDVSNADDTHWPE